MIEAVVFDVGETLLDDTREWAAWADWLGVPRHTVSALVGAVTAQGQDNADALRLLRPGIDIEAERQAREDAGRGEAISEADLYPDVRPALSELRAAGQWVGVVGNQTARAAGLLRALALPVDAVATSGEWGLVKPAPEFFAQVCEWSGRSAESVLYVGDHRDFDVVAAREAGLRSALVRRGVLGYLWADDPVTVGAADFRVDSLTELPGLLRTR